MYMYSANKHIFQHTKFPCFSFIHTYYNIHISFLAQQKHEILTFLQALHLEIKIVFLPQYLYQLEEGLALSHNLTRDEFLNQRIGSKIFFFLFLFSSFSPEMGSFFSSQFLWSWNFLNILKTYPWYIISHGI